MVATAHMKPQIEPGELMQRIRREARRPENLMFPADAISPNGDAAPMPPVPVLAVAQSGGFSCESLMAQVGNMIDRARDKSAVRKDVPRWLRPLFRNQGGYNDIVLEALTRLRETNRHLLAENIQLRLHVERQTEWMQAAERHFARADKHLRDLEEETGLYQGAQSREL